MTDHAFLSDHAVMGAKQPPALIASSSDSSDYPPSNEGVKQEAALSRITAHLARYTCAGPIPLRLEASLSSDGLGIDLDAYATVPDACEPGATAMVRHHNGVALDADDAEVERVITMLVGIAYSHEREHWFCRDGLPVKDPHRGPGGRL